MGVDRKCRASDQEVTRAAEQIKNEIAALKADQSVPEMQKKEGLAQLEAALKIAKPIQFKENIALVLKYFDQLVVGGAMDGVLPAAAQRHRRLAHGIAWYSAGYHILQRGLMVPDFIGPRPVRAY